MSTPSTHTHEPPTAQARCSVARWAAVNAAAMSAAWGLFGLFGGTIEALGAEHDSSARDLSLLTAFILGGSLFAHLRQRTLLPRVPRTKRVAAAAIVGLTVGFVAGFLIAGPPLDFVLGIFAIGAVAGAVEWRILRHQLRRYGILAAIGAVAWLVAGVAAIAPAALFGDAIDAAVGGGTASFVTILLLIGFVGGAAGGALEGLALRSRVT